MGRLSKIKPLIAVDADGVLSDFTSYLLDRIKINTTEPVPRSEDIVEYKIENFLTDTQKEYMHKICRVGNFWGNLPVIPGAKDGIAEMKRFGFDVIVVTSAWTDCPDWTWHRMLWLNRNFAIDNRNIYVCRRKENISADVLIDDYDKNIEDFLRVQTDKIAIMLVQPWNANSKLNITKKFNFARMTWDEIISSLPELAYIYSNK